MLSKSLFALSALAASLHGVAADQAITAPSNGSTISGKEVEFRWYSDDGEGKTFDVALISMVKLGEYDVATDRVVSELITVPSNLTEGSYYLAINELDTRRNPDNRDDDNDGDDDEDDDDEDNDNDTDNDNDNDNSDDNDDDNDNDNDNGRRQFDSDNDNDNNNDVDNNNNDVDNNDNNNNNNNDDDRDYELGIDKYDLKFDIAGDGQEDSSRFVVLNVTTSNGAQRRSAFSRRDPRVAKQLAKRQIAPIPNDDDEALFSPSNSSVEAGSTFNFTYQTDDEETDRVAVALFRIYTGLQGQVTVNSTDERTTFQGTIALPDDIVPGQYYFAVFSDDDEQKQPGVGEYDLSFSTRARLRGNNDIRIIGNDAPIVVTVENNSTTVTSA